METGRILSGCSGSIRFPEFCGFLVCCGATSMSVNPDTVVYTRKLVASLEQKIMLEKLQGIDRSDPDWKMEID